MKINRIKINYSLTEKKASFQYMSDNGQWVDVYKGSELSRNKCATAIGEGRIEELLETINRIYNLNGCGVAINYSGDETVYTELLAHAQNYDGIRIERKELRCIIIGKRNAGKTCLAEGIMNYLGSEPRIEDDEECTAYYNDTDGISLYEIKGIDFGLENIDKAYDALIKRLGSGAVTILYCFLAKTGKIENTEINFVKRLEREHLGIKVKPVITGCIDEKGAKEFAHRIVEEMGDREVFITLAKDMNTKIGVIPSFGIDHMISNLAGNRN